MTARVKKEFTLTPSTIRMYTSKLNTATKLGIVLDGSMKFNEISNIINELDLLKPIYRKTSNFGHFGRDGFTWEVVKTLK